MKPVYVRAGDVFFTRSESVLGKLIRWAETDPGEEPTWANHTGVVVESGWIGPAGSRVGNLNVPIEQARQAVVVEALWKTRRGPLKVNGIDVRVFGPIPNPTPEELDAFRAEAATYVGDTYGWWKLLFHLADRAIFKGRKVLSKTLYVDKRPICSYLAAKVGAVVGLTYGMDPAAATPDEMLDYCESNPDEWVER